MKTLFVLKDFDPATKTILVVFVTGTRIESDGSVVFTTGSESHAKTFDLDQDAELIRAVTDIVFKNDFDARDHFYIGAELLLL